MTPNTNNTRMLEDLEYLEQHIAQAVPEELYENANHIYNLALRNIGKIESTPDEHLKTRYVAIINNVMKYLPPPPKEQEIRQQIKTTNMPDFQIQRNTQQVVKSLQNKLKNVENYFSKITPQPFLKQVIYSILTHCNLKCKGCSHFAPINEEHFVSPDVISRDLLQFSKLTDNDNLSIFLVGGEPLLHPDLINIMVDTRKHHPENPIVIVTNGLLLPSQTPTFWNACHEHKVKIETTRYPINVDYDKIENTAKTYGVSFSFVYSSTAVKTMRKNPMDINGKQNPTSSFLNCVLSNNCFVLREGVIYPCAVTANSPYFNKKFNTNMRIDKKDYLDIYSIDSYDKLASFLSKPVPFCRYCDISKTTEGHPWELSKRDISEWM